MMLRHMGWSEAADLIVHATEKTLGQKVVTYDFARLMEGAPERARFPRLVVTYLAADFSKGLALPSLDGIVMANSLHFVRHKEPAVQLVKRYLKPGGQIVLVEYNTNAGNPWVSYPLSFDTWQQLAGRCGFISTRKLAAVPSRFLGEIYSAQSRMTRTD